MRLSAGRPKRVWKDSSPDIRFVSDRQCRWRKLGRRWWICKRQVGGQIRRCRRIMRGRNWRNGARWQGSSMGSRWSRRGNRYFRAKKGAFEWTIRKVNAQNRPVSVLFVRLGVLVFGQSKHRGFCANALGFPLAGSGAEGFSASWWGMQSPDLGTLVRSQPARP